MHILKSRQGTRRNAGARLLARMALALLLTFAASVGLFCAPVLADEAQETEVKTAIETFLRNYTQEAMLYEETDQRPCSVYEPAFVPAWEQESLPVNGKYVLLTELQKNIQFVEKKAAFYAAMRQMQNIYRENLQLYYTYTSLKISGNSARASVKETAKFYYTDSNRQSVYETNYTIDAVKFMDRWLVADVTDGSRFDGLYKKKPDFDLEAVLSEFADGLEKETAVVTYPYTPSEDAEAGRIFYNGANAAAYASTYCRQDEGIVQKNYYNAQFKSYAGIGGDCMNFTSQCLWAGFGGNQTANAINEHALPMDTAGSSTWYGRSTAAGIKDSSIINWISCAGFWNYVKGTNASSDTGMYATVITVSGNSPITGVAPQELVGAAAHVEGAKGSFSHAIIFTAATGNSRNEIWFCSHTKDVSHLKLGDYYFGPIRVYIPRYMRVSAEQKPVITPDRITPDRIAPVLVNTSAAVGFHTEAPQARLSTVVQAPDGTKTHVGLAENAASCSASYQFTQTGLYQVDCTATTAGGAAQTLTYYIRCVTEGVRTTASAPVPGPEPAVDPEAEVPWSVLPEEEGADAPEASAEAAPEAAEAEPVPFPDMPTVEIESSLLQPAA